MSIGLVNTDSDGHNMRRIVSGKNRMDIDKCGYSFVGSGLHKRIIEGTQFYGSHLFQSVANGSSATMLIVTSSTEHSHGIYTVTATSSVSFQFFEDSTIGGSTHGTSVATFNQNRSVATSTATDSETSLWHTPTVLTDGTELEIGLIGGTGNFSKQGGEDVSQCRWQLDSSSSYTIKVTNTAGGASTDILVTFSWHDH